MSKILNESSGVNDGSLPQVHSFEVSEPYERRSQWETLRRWNTVWKFISGLSLICCVLSFVMTSMVVSYSHNPTFINDFLSSWSYANSYQFGPVGPHHRHHVVGAFTVEKLNKGKQVLPIHSHNDYWRRVPFFQALSLGCQSIEADVWFIDGKDHDLFVGHHKRSLSSFKTLHRMYLEPLEMLLDSVNDHDVLLNDAKLGVFDADPLATLYFVLDVKNQPEQVFQLAEQSFHRFLEKGYLTTFNTTSSEWSYGPVTVILSGDLPVQSVKDQEIRTMFIDAPMYKIVDDEELQRMYDISNGLSIFASSSLVEITGSRASRSKGGLTAEESLLLSKSIDLAHRLGLKMRVWETPAWPAIQRDLVWKELLQMGVDLINADDLEAAVAL